MNTTDTVSGCGRWFLYLLACGRGAGEMRLIGCCFDRSAALRAEARVKKLPRQAKLALWAAAESRAVAAA